jgi:hypothetical protein
MVDIANPFRVGGRIDLTGFIGENRDQAAIAGIEIKMALLGPIQVGLLEDKGHTQDAFPKVNRGLPVGPDQRDMVNPLGLYFFHV